MKLSGDDRMIHTYGRSWRGERSRHAHGMTRTEWLMIGAMLVILVGAFMLVLQIVDVTITGDWADALRHAWAQAGW